MRKDAMIRFARRLRRDVTDAERLLWFHLRDRGAVGVRFRRRSPVGPFVADFLGVEARLIVELDASPYGEGVDASRTRFLQRRGFRVLRFWNHDVLVRTERVLAAVVEAIAAARSAGAAPADRPGRPRWGADRSGIMTGLPPAPVPCPRPSASPWPSSTSRWARSSATPSGSG